MRVVVFCLGIEGRLEPGHRRDALLAVVVRPSESVGLDAGRIVDGRRHVAGAAADPAVVWPNSVASVADRNLIPTTAPSPPETSVPLEVSVIPAPAWKVICPAPPCWKVISSSAALTLASIVTVTALALVVRFHLPWSAATCV